MVPFTLVIGTICLQTERQISLSCFILLFIDEKLSEIPDSFSL